MNNKKNIYILGVGHFTEVIIDLAESCGYNVIGLYHFDDSRNGEMVLNVPIISSYKQLLNTDIKDCCFAVSIGDNILRNTYANKIRENGGITPNLIHPKAIISKYANLSIEGVHVNANAFIHTRATIENDCIISPNATVSHHSIVKKGSIISIGSIVGAYSIIGEYTLLGMNATTINKRINIGSNTVVGINTAVINNIPDNSVIAGVPSKDINKRNV